MIWDQIFWDINIRPDIETLLEMLTALYAKWVEDERGAMAAAKQQQLLLAVSQTSCSGLANIHHF